MDIAEAVRDWVAGALGPDVETAYGELPVKNRHNVSGGGIKRFAYELYLRVQPRGSEARRFDALSALRGLQARIEAHEAPDAGVAWTGHEVTQCPNEYTVEKDGRAVYQMKAVLTYHERG